MSSGRSARTWIGIAAVAGLIAYALLAHDGLRTGGADLTMQSTWLEISMVLNTRATMASRKLGTTSSFWHPHVHARLTTASTDLPTLRLKLLALQTLNP